MSLGVECGPLRDDEQRDQRLVVEAAVLRSYGLGRDELDVILDDFTERAISDGDRRALRSMLS